ncbi:MAG: lauroyl acyltransferase [Leptospiraceae bacterium]|nr:lauroyl acyltransferase [Leptospiraceae bacterium]
MTVVRDYLFYLLLVGFVFPFRILPYRVCLAYGKFIVLMLYPLAGKQRKIIAENLRHAFPDKDEAWIAGMISRNWRHMGALLADSFYGPRMTAGFYAKHCVYDPGSREAEAAARARGRGVICNCGHLGSWELLVQYCGRILQGGGIYKKLSNRYIDQWYKKVREASGIELFEVEDSQQAIRYLRRGGWVGFVSDQNAGHSGVFVNFFQRPASTFRGPVLMAGVAGAGMLFYSAVHGPDKKVHLRIKDLGLIDLKKFADREEAIRHYTEIWVRELEREARLYPEQYFWVHKRWKTRPEDVDRILAIRKAERTERALNQ